MVVKPLDEALAVIADGAMLVVPHEVVAPQLAEVYPQFARQVFGLSVPSP